MPITIRYGNPALVGAAAFGIGREKGRQKAGAKAADMAQGMLDRRDKKRDDERNRYDRLRKEGADRQQKAAIERGRIAQDQDEARMRAEADFNKAQQRQRERAEDFDFRRQSQQAGFDQRDKEQAARERAAREAAAAKTRPAAPSKYFPTAPSATPAPSAAPAPPEAAASVDAPFDPSKLTPEQRKEYEMLAEQAEMGDYDPENRRKPRGYVDNLDEEGRKAEREARRDMMRGLDPRYNYDGSLRSEGAFTGGQLSGRNKRGYVPQRTAGAQRSIAARQQRYEAEADTRESLERYAFSKEQERRIAELDSFKNKIISGRTPQLDPEQQQSAINQIENEKQQIVANPNGERIEQTPQIQDSFEMVDVGGTQMPLTMGENGQPQVMSGYTPPQQPQQPATEDAQAEFPEFLSDQQKGMLQGFAPTGQGSFMSEPIMSQDDADVRAFDLENQGFKVNKIADPNKSGGTILQAYPVPPKEKPAVKDESGILKPLTLEEYARDSTVIEETRDELAKINRDYEEWPEEKVVKWIRDHKWQNYVDTFDEDVMGKPEPEPEPEAKKKEEPKIDKEKKGSTPKRSDAPKQSELPEESAFSERTEKRQSSQKATKPKLKSPADLQAMQAAKNKEQYGKAFQYTKKENKKKYKGNADSFLSDDKKSVKEKREFIENLMLERMEQGR